MDKSSFRRAEAKMVQPKPALTREESEDTSELIEAQAAFNKREVEKQRAEDKIGALIGAHWFITNWTTPILLHPTLPQLSVSRFYPDSMIAVDIFTHIGEWEKMIIDFKRKAFKEHDVEHGGNIGRVKYGALSYADPLAALVPQLES